jgi:gamma-glutamyltranspeptidase/glutathione hydrolase
MAGTAGIVASGHELSSAAGAEALAAGGNAFDAALSALCAACVCEPLLTSLGGGGFLMARPAHGEPSVYDFFAHTPARRQHEKAIDFFPILADFGTTKQEFHIGLGSMAVPGTVAGLFEVQRRHCRLDMEDIVAPATRFAREGVEINALQENISQILLPILEASPGAMRLVATEAEPDHIAPAGSVVTHHELAGTLEALAREGSDLFYRGELARRLADDCREQGGQLTLADLDGYRVIRRAPVALEAMGAKFAFNAPPSPGASLLAFALSMLEGIDLRAAGWGTERHCLAIAHAIEASARLREATRMDRDLDERTLGRLLAPEQLAQWRQLAMPSELFSRGTTHISVADEEGNLASLTTTNGEGCAYVLPGTGIMLNNMLGEQDLNPDGFHRWPENRRLASMMCPTVARMPDGGLLALGSGGSNRIRSAMLQVLVNLLAFDLDLEAAVNAPRMHLEGSKLSIEHGYPAHSLAVVEGRWPDCQQWPDRSIFFGGVHAVEKLPDGRFRGAGDPRRGGLVAENQ